MGLDRWIGVSWVRWWRGFGSVVASGFGLWRLVDFGFWVWALRGFGSIMANGFGSELGFGFWIWDQCGSIEIGDHGDFFFLGLMVQWVVLGYVGVTMCWWWHGGGVVAMGVTVC